MKLDEAKIKAIVDKKLTEIKPTDMTYRIKSDDKGELVAVVSVTFVLPISDVLAEAPK